MMVRCLGSVYETLVVSLLLSVLSWSQSNNPPAASLPKSVAAAATSAAAPAANDSAQEAVVFDRISKHLTFESDGSGTEDSELVAHIQSQAGLQNFAILSFPYTSYNTTVEVEYVRVKKPDGTVVVTPEYNIQDMPGDATRGAPMYSDLHEKHVVKALAVGESVAVGTLSGAALKALAGDLADLLANEIELGDRLAELLALPRELDA